MKKERIGLVIVLCSLNCWQAALAQGTAFTYQGQLRANNASAVGSYDLMFTLFDTNTDGVAIAGPLTNSAINVSNGVFTVMLDFGNQFSGAPRWLEIGVRTNGGGAFTTLAPRQPLTPAPYAIMAGSASNFLGTLPAAQISGTYSNQVLFNNGANVFDGTFIGQFLGSTFTGGTFTGQFIGDGSGLTGLWRTAGNFGTTPGLNFVGTTDNQSLIFKVNNVEAMRYEPTAETPNIIGGWSGNYAQPGLTGVTIGGGGTLGGNQPNIAIGNAYNSTIAGGYHNTVANYAAAILGGSVNNASGYFATIGAGQFHTNFGDYAFIGSGQYNGIQSNSPYGFIGGGYLNTIQTNSYAAVIGGGAVNNIGPSAAYAIIAGGNGITNLAGYTFVGGGYANLIASNANMSSIGGGLRNSIGGDTKASGFYGEAPSTIGGGMQNTIQSNSAWSSIGGGFLNQIQSYAFISSIGGGYANIIQGSSNYWANFNVYGATIGGGAVNLIETNSGYSTIAGGLQNVVRSNSVSSFIGGGYFNSLGGSASYSTMGGGYFNTIGFGSLYSFIGAGFENVIQTNDFHAVISGGALNVIQTDAHDSAIGGGYQNLIQTNSWNGVIGGGYTNVILPSALFSTISGGVSNIVGNTGSTIPGGYGNGAMGSNSFAAGTFAQATNDGSFVLTDQHYANFYSTADNQLSARFLGGIRFVTGGSGMTLDGLPVLSGTVPPGGLSGNYTSPVNLSNPGNSFTGSFTGDGSNLTNVNAATLGGIASSGFWKTTGNAGTTPGVNFIGTTDNKPLMIKGSFVGIGRTNAITSAEFFGVDAPVGAGNYGGMYVNTTNIAGLPFYGYAQSNNVAAYHFVDGNDTNKWKLVVAGSVRLTVANNGFVGIGTTVPDSLLSVNGAASKPSGGSWAVFSDLRLKKNIEPLTGALVRLLQLRPVTFEYKDPESIHEAPGVQIGMIAQEVEKVFPDWVDTAPNGMKRLSIHGFEALTVQALRELREEKDARISALERQNAEIEKELAAERENHRQLEARFSALEAAVARLSDRADGPNISLSPQPATVQASAPGNAFRSTR